MFRHASSEPTDKLILTKNADNKFAVTDDVEYTNTVISGTMWYCMPHRHDEAGCLR